MPKEEDKDIQLLVKRIRQLRLEKGLTQEKVSELMEFDDGSYRRLESGRSSPTYKTIVRLCKALDISLGEFFKNL